MFADRAEAGSLLATELSELPLPSDPVVIGITRGGVVVASTIVSHLQLPLDILVIKKINAPKNPELAIGAVGPKQTVYLEEEIIKESRIPKTYVDKVMREKSREQHQKERIFRRSISEIPLGGRSVILVDDGVATGATAQSAATYLRSQKVKHMVLAVPVIARPVLRDMVGIFDDVVVLAIDRYLVAVGKYYEDFSQVEDEEVISLVQKHRKNQ